MNRVMILAAGLLRELREKNIYANLIFSRPPMNQPTKYLLLSLIGLAAGNVWATDRIIHTSSNSLIISDLIQTERGWIVSPDAMEEAYNMRLAKYIVVNATSTYSLDEFVKSGKFCEWRGKHEWIPEAEVGLNTNTTFVDRFKCSICKKNRKKIKRELKALSESWEP